MTHQILVVITDGFTGNVILKTLEGLIYMLRDLIGSKVKRNPVYLAGGIAMFPLLRDLKGKLKPEKYGGAPLLGLGGLVMKALKKDAGVRYWGNRSSITGAVGLLDRIAVLCFAAPVLFHSVRWYFQLPLGYR